MYFLEVLVDGEDATAARLARTAFAGHTGLGVLADAFLEKVGLGLPHRLADNRAPVNDANMRTCNEMSSIHVKGLVALYVLATPSAISRRSCARLSAEHAQTAIDTHSYRNKLNVCAHELGVHPDERHRQRVTDDNVSC